MALRTDFPISYLKPNMCGLGLKNLQVLWRIVSFVSVNVVDDLTKTKGTLQYSSGNNSVDSFSADLLVVDRMSGEVDSPATVGTESTAALGLVSRTQVERDAALLARFVGATTTTQSVACLGTPTPTARFRTLLARVHFSILSWFSQFCLKPENMLPFGVDEVAS